MKHCNGCGRDLPDTKFSKDRMARDGLQPRCKECKAKYNVKPEVRVRTASNRLAAVVSDTEEWYDDDDASEYLAAVGFARDMIDEEM